jgi:hypothetical protein
MMESVKVQEQKGKDPKIQLLEYCYWPIQRKNTGKAKAKEQQRAPGSFC